MDQPKLERLLRLMKLLTANTTYNVDQLAERLQMSRRTVYRYIDTFREAGFVIKKSGDCIRLDKESPHFRDISQLVHFTEEEAVILKNTIENIDDTNMLKQNLKRKLYSVYDNKTLADTVVRGKNAPNIRRLIEAIEQERQAVLHGYLSAHGGGVRDRRVEPFAFTTNYVQVWCYDLESHTNKLFKTSRIGSVELSEAAWEHQEAHSEGFIDAFRMHGGARRRVRLELGTLAYNLLCEEYPLAERDVKPLGRGRWSLDTEVAGMAGVGRFVVGLLDDIRIVDSPELTGYIREYIAANTPKMYIFHYISTNFESKPHETKSPPDDRRAVPRTRRRIVLPASSGPAGKSLRRTRLAERSRSRTDGAEHRKPHAREREFPDRIVDRQQLAGDADGDSRRRRRGAGTTPRHRPVPARGGGHGTRDDGRQRGQPRLRARGLGRLCDPGPGRKMAQHRQHG